VMQKKTTVEQNLNAIRMTEEKGIPCFANMMFGMPGETLDTVRETKEFLIRADLHSGQFWASWATAYPGTPLFETLREKGGVPDVRKYLFEIGAISELRINFTDVPREALYGAAFQLPMEVDLAYYRKRKLRLQTARAFIKLCLVRLYLASPGWLKRIAKSAKNYIKRKFKTGGYTIRSSTVDIERYIAARVTRF